MSAKIRVLGIVPYEGMKPLLSKLAEEYENIDLTILVGDLKKGVEIAQSNFHENYDVIISRGGTAKLLRQSVSLPVIEINTSAYDILRTLKLSGADTKKVAIVGFSAITEQSLFLKEVLPYTMDVYPINSADEALIVLKHLMSSGYHAVLCDMITYTTAQTLGMDAFLITSGMESIRAALETAVQYCRNNSALRDENHFLRFLIRGRAIQTVVFTGDGKLFFSTVSDNDTKILELLHSEIGSVSTNEKRHLLYRQNNMVYSIQAQRFFSGEIEYVAFYFSVSKAPLSGNKCGISYSNYKEVEKEYFESFYSVTNSFAPLKNTIDQVNQSLCPVMIAGEQGTGKEEIAKVIYLRSSLKNQPFIQIDCGLLNDKVWDYLMNHHNSPLCGEGNTVFFKNINTLSQERQKQLWTATADMDICKRNRVMISCISNSQRNFDSNSMVFINQLNLFLITLPPLRNDPSRIDSIANLYLNRSNGNRKKQILGFSPDALQMLRNFSWPYNYTQFSRVMNGLVTTANGSYIDADNVRIALHKELAITPASTKDSVNSLDLSLTLSQINREIAFMVLETQNGNHSKAAKSLGISRTTLWRLINEKK
jgi:transcriptional regulator with PAS, ATPase and Fis domain